MNRPGTIRASATKRLAAVVRRAYRAAPRPRGRNRAMLNRPQQREQYGGGVTAC